MSRIVAGVCMITVSLRALCGDVDCRGAAAGLSVGGCVLHAARCGEMTPAPRPWLLSSSYPRVYQVIPGYTRLYQHSRNTFQLMNITRCSFYSRSCHQEADASRLLVMNQQPPAEAHLLNWGISLLNSASAALLNWILSTQTKLFIYLSV